MQSDMLVNNYKIVNGVGKMKNIYKGLSKYNDIKAISKGRVVERVWNKTLLKLVRKFMK